MNNFTKDTAQKILKNEISVETLLQQYPEYKEEVLKEISVLKDSHGDNVVLATIDKYKSSAQIATSKISKSGYNTKTVNAFLPMVIKARFALYLLERLNISAASKTLTEKTQFSLWDGAILQKLLFKKDFERKPVALGVFKFFWPFIKDKKILMPLVNQKGIYCFFTKELISGLANLIGNKNCLEIAAGDGTLTRFLNDKHVNCRATDDYSWNHYITYPDFVEKADAKTALQKYNPEVVICSWPAPGNSFEKKVFDTNSVLTYIVIGTKNPAYTGDFNSYYKAENFTMELNEKLSSLIIPPSDENAVYIFRRK